jgi:ATP-dependent protease ClpP protease subunit
MTDEFACDAGKRGWLNYHRWRTPPADARLEIAGHISGGTVEFISRILNRDPLAPIYATIDSPGGDPFEALRCYRALRAHRAPVHAHVASRCSSAAVLVLAAADERTASPIAWLQMHNAEYALPRIGRHTAAVMRDGARDLDQVDEEMAAILALRCSRYPMYQLRNEMRDEVMLDAEQAWLRGLLTQPPA